MTNKRIFGGTLLLLLLPVLFSCSTFPTELVKPYIGKSYWTRTNLHHRGRVVYWQNYLNLPILPIGTPVRLKSISEGVCEVVDENGKTYEFLFPGEDFSYAERAISYYLTEVDPAKTIMRYPREIRKKIRSGQLQKSMTKKQVLMAIGYPALAFENSVYLDLNNWDYLEKEQKEEKTEKRVLVFREDIASNTLTSIQRSNAALYKLKDYDNLDPREVEKTIKKRLEKVDDSLVQKPTVMMK